MSATKKNHMEWFIFLFRRNWLVGRRNWLVGLISTTFYLQLLRLQSAKKTDGLTVFLHFLDLGSISSMFYEQLLCKQIQKFQKDWQLDCLFCAFGICACKSCNRTLMKLTPAVVKAMCKMLNVGFIYVWM